MKKRNMRNLFVKKRILSLAFLFLLLSPASGSTSVSSGLPTGRIYGIYGSKAGIFLKDSEIFSSFFVQDLSSSLIEKREEKSKHFGNISPLLLLAAGILAGFNPCLLAVMAFLASVTLVKNGKRKEMLKITLGFSAGIFTMYMLGGISVLSVISFLPEIQENFIKTSILIIYLLGFWHIFDAYWLKKHSQSTFRTPRILRDFMSRMDKNNLLLLSFLSGSMFSLVKAPCVGAIYLSILSILATKTDILRGTIYMGLYNFGLLLPVITLGLLLSFGLSPNTVTQFRERWRVEIRLTTGFILIFVALLTQLGII